MIKFFPVSKIALQVVLVLCALLGAGVVASKENIFTEATVTSKFSSFNTELFNLLLNKNNVMDGKNRFDRGFSDSFDKLLSGAPAVRNTKQLALLRKRLLSGPESKPIFLLSNGKNYFYYGACQAHACNETSLALLYEPESKRMGAQLFINGNVEVIGDLSTHELKIVDQLKAKR